MKTAYFIIIGALLLVAVFALSMSIGKYSVSLSEIARVLQAKLTGGTTGLDPNIETVVWQVRLPRVIGGLLIGAGLAVSGTVYQGLFRNPLVSPDILGVSTGASLGAVAGIFFSQPVIVIQALAFVGGLIAVALVYVIGSSVRRHDPVLVLAGVAIGAMLGAVLSLLKILADPYNQLPAITFWLLGSLSAINFADIVTNLPVIIRGFIPLVLLRWRLNILTLDEQEAQALGVETKRIRIVAIRAFSSASAERERWK